VAILFSVSQGSNQSKAPDTPVIKKEKKNGYFMLFICNLDIYIYISYNLRSYKKKRGDEEKLRRKRVRIEGHFTPPECYYYYFVN
jgi:hypothetical protein